MDAIESEPAQHDVAPVNDDAMPSHGGSDVGGSDAGTVRTPRAIDGGQMDLGL